MTEKNWAPLGKIKDFMEEALDKHGPTPLAVCWRSRENQFLRFDQFRPLFAGHAEPFSLNDLGCGLADLYAWTKERGLPVSRYVGYDLSERMLAAARTLHPDPVAHFVQAERPSEIADFSIGCGIFNTRLDESDAAWTEFMRSAVRTLAESSRVGFAFNALTSYVDWRVPHLFYADPAEWFTWCKTNISKKVTLLHDYPLYEWTMIVRI